MLIFDDDDKDDKTDDLFPLPLDDDEQVPIYLDKTDKLSHMQQTNNSLGGFMIVSSPRM
jgi:hypothetical protein